jgi:hypothetical protein
MTIVETPAPAETNGRSSAPAMVAANPWQLARKATWLEHGGDRVQALGLRDLLLRAGRCMYCGQKLKGERSRRLGAGKQCRARHGV